MASYFHNLVVERRLVVRHITINCKVVVQIITVTDTVEVDRTVVVVMRNLACRAAVEDITNLALIGNPLEEIGREVAISTVVNFHPVEGLDREVVTSTVVDFRLVEGLGREVATSTVADFHLEEGLGREVVASTVVDFHLEEGLGREVVASTVVDFHLE